VCDLSGPSVTLVRHATLVLETSLGRILVDPMLRAAGTSPAVDNTPNPRPNPLVELPLPPEEVVAGADLCIVDTRPPRHRRDRRGGGAVSGWVVDGVYVAGDTIWCPEVEAAIATHEPHTVVVNAGGARFLTGDPIVMDTRDVAQARRVTTARVVAVHLEAINHCIEPRAAYRAIEGVSVPEDGETLR